MLWAIVAALLSGFVIGGIARFAVPGPDPMPWWGTILVGWAGSFLGGVVARVFLGTTGGILLAILGAVVIVVAYRLLVQKRPLTGPRAHRHP